jgi:carboxypeptidase family protein/TonB-dependent receptor-like protein
MTTTRFARLAGVAALMALAAAAARAQEVTGSISGSVEDQQGQVIPGATVTAVNERTGALRVDQTDAKGNFLFTAMPPGTYAIKVEMSNFRTAEQKGNVLTASSRLSVGTIKLTIGLGESVVVEASGNRVNTEETQHAGLITASQIAQVQTKARDVTSLMRLVPGVRYQDSVDALGDSFGTDVPQVSGMRRDWNHITVDGVLGNEVGQTNKMAQQINLDAVAEIRILLNTFRAEYGRTGGAHIEIISKSGDPQYRGNAYYYGRNEHLNANNFFNNRSGRERPRYRFNTYGFNLGGPIPGLNKDGAKKLFFFYSLEAPITEKPGNLLNWTMPTERERSGDFSQTLDSSGRLIVIRDPQTGQPFPGNIIPANRINRNGQALLNVLPLPNTLDRSLTRGQYNHQTQFINDNPRMNNILRLDWRPSPSDSLYVTFKDWKSDQRGVGGTGGVTAGPAGWGWFNAHYDNTDRTYSLSHTHIFSSSLVNEVQAGARRQSENFRPVSDDDLRRLSRSGNNFTLGQFHPELNPIGALPKVTFGGSGTPNPPNFTYDNRIVGDGGVAWVHSFNDSLTWIKGSHAFKTGFYLEHLYNTEGKAFSAPASFAGQYDFTPDTNNPLDTGYTFANALLGNFKSYSEIDALPEVNSHRYLVESFLQDTWKATRRLTLDYGVRLLWFKPWYTKLPAATFVPERYSPAKAPRLYQPAKVNGVNVALDPVTGQTKPNIFVGSFVPGTGDPFNGMVLNSDSSYPKGFRDNQGIQPEPRLGFAYDVTGKGKTAIHGGVGLFHNSQITARSMDQSAANPPAVNSPQFVYGNMDTLLSQGSFSLRPSTVIALERDAKTPSTYQWSLGVQQDLGWGTVVDLTYVGWVGRHMEQYTNINVVPDGAKFLNLHPENANPQSATTAKPDDFLRPYLGYGDILLRSNFGTANYNGLQVQLNRRYIHGLQFAVAYTYARSLGLADEDESQVSISRPIRAWHYAPLQHNQTHELVVTYTWDVPKASKLWDNAFVRTLFDGWQLSGENALISGEWDRINIATTDNFDFTGGTGGQGAALPGTGANDLRVVRPNIVGNVTGGKRNPTPGGDGSWLDPTAVARPAKGEYGNASRYSFRRPAVNNWNLSFFKNFGLGGEGKRRLQLRWEMYNVLNHTQFNEIDATARFDPAGKQVNAAFGEATSARNPRIMQGSIRLSF